MEQVKDITWVKETCHVVAKTVCYTGYELWASLHASAIFHLEAYFWLVDDCSQCLSTLHLSFIF